MKVTLPECSVHRTVGDGKQKNNGMVLVVKSCSKTRVRVIGYLTGQVKISAWEVRSQLHYVLLCVVIKSTMR